MEGPLSIILPDGTRSKPKATTRVSGGIPNVPKGEQVIEPINAWGRPMPKVEEPRRHLLWQVHVKDAHDNKIKGVGPQMAKEFAEMFMLTISQQIALGAEQRWSQPHLVLMI